MPLDWGSSDQSYALKIPRIVCDRCYEMFRSVYESRHMSYVQCPDSLNIFHLLHHIGCSSFSFSLWCGFSRNWQEVLKEIWYLVNSQWDRDWKLTTRSSMSFWEESVGNNHADMWGHAEHHAESKRFLIAAAIACISCCLSTYMHQQFKLFMAVCTLHCWLWRKGTVAQSNQQPWAIGGKVECFCPQQTEQLVILQITFTQITCSIVVPAHHLKVEWARDDHFSLLNNFCHHQFQTSLYPLQSTTILAASFRTWSVTFFYKSWYYKSETATSKYSKRIVIRKGQSRRSVRHAPSKRLPQASFRHLPLSWLDLPSNQRPTQTSPLWGCDGTSECTLEIASQADTGMAPMTSPIGPSLGVSITQATRTQRHLSANRKQKIHSFGSKAHVKHLLQNQPCICVMPPLH